MYIVLMQKQQGSKYADELFRVYNYPVNQYHNNIHEGDVFVYYQPGDMYYYGTGRIGKLLPSDKPGYNNAELLDTVRFDYELPAYLPDGKYIETLGRDKAPAVIRAVRKLSPEAYQYIMEHAGIKPEVISASSVENGAVYDYGPRDSQDRIVKDRKRDKHVVDAVKKKAAGHCQLCGAEAPFTDTDGLPYLECHHVIWLADGGADSVYNAVALCPNCHRKMHVLRLPEDIKKLTKIAKNYK